MNYNTLQNNQAFDRQVVYSSPPAYTTAERDLINLEEIPYNTIIWNKTDEELQVWNGTEWESVCDGVKHVDGGRADSNYGGVAISPIDGGGA